MSAFDSGVTYQLIPDQGAYPVYDVDIVSPELPCGSAWLVNCLLELGIPVFKPWNAHVADEWQALGERRYRYARADEPWSRTLPALKYGRIFDFRCGPVPRVQHVWPMFYPPGAKTIFFVRDPRDALYSAWQRARRSGQIAEDMDFVAFATGRYFHYPLSHSEYLLLFLRLWRSALGEREHLVLRYEDYREDAIGTLRRATTFLNIQTDDAALRHAVDCSDFSALHGIERGQLARGVIRVPLNRAGRAYEYRETFDAAMHAALGGRFASIHAWLRYAADQAQSSATGVAANDVEPLLLAMQADRLAVPAQSWLRRHLVNACTDISLRAAWP